MSTRVVVTREQVEAAKTALAVLESTNRPIDPLLKMLAEARTVRRQRPTGQDAERPVGTSAEVAQYEAAGGLEGSYKASLERRRKARRARRADPGRDVGR